MASNGRPRKPPALVVPKEPFAREIARILRDEELTQTEASYLLRDQPSQLSLVVNGHLDGFSHERLVKYLTRLGRDVDIRIGPSRGASGKVRIKVR
jgi:predicted XRE-type DNA-binding protein